MSAGSQSPSQRGRMLSKRFLRTRSKNLVNRECRVCGLKSSFEYHLARLPSSLPHLIFFLYTSRWKTSQSANEMLPTDGNRSSSQSSPGASLALVPPRRFYNTLHLHKVLLRGKKKKKKAGPVNEWPLKRILPLVFCGSHGLVWFIIPQQEVNKDTFEHRCIQIHRRKKKFKARHFFWNLRKHVVAEGSLTGTFVFSSFIQAASLMRQTITTSTLSASALRLLRRNLQNFSKVRTVPVIPTGWTFSYIHSQK